MPKTKLTSWLGSGAITFPKLIFLLIALGSAAAVPFKYVQSIAIEDLPIYFAAFQAAVCLILFWLVPKPVPPDHLFSLDLRDVIAPHCLVRRLQTGKGPYKLILTQLKQTRHQVEQFVDQVDRKFLGALVEDFNRMIAGKARIYDPDLFRDIKLSQETLNIQNDPTAPSIRANRMLIEDLFTEELQQYPRNDETVNRACRNIKLWIQLMFLFWAIYYGMTAFATHRTKLETLQTPAPNVAASVVPSQLSAAPPAQNQSKPKSREARAFNLVLNILSTLTAVLIFFLYVEMSELTLVDQATKSWVQPQTNPRQQVRNAFEQKASFAAVALLVISANTLSVIFVPHPTFIENFVDTIIACGSGIVMALVVGRLDSKFLDPGTWAVAILYLYAVIQPVAIYFDNQNSRFYATTLALFLKAFLWLVFYWAFTDGELWSYVVAMRKLLLGETPTSAEALSN